MTQSQALTQALYLSLIAPDDARAEMAANLAEDFAAGLTSGQVEAAKAAALELMTGAA
tara:strand:+ start:1130 stop:1303 length:174 start_codon:yes stop_codon:yes gene_type:complete